MKPLLTRTAPCSRISWQVTLAELGGFGDDRGARRRRTPKSRAKKWKQRRAGVRRRKSAMPVLNRR